MNSIKTVIVRHFSIGSYKRPRPMIAMKRNSTVVAIIIVVFKILPQMNNNKNNNNNHKIIRGMDEEYDDSDTEME